MTEKRRLKIFDTTLRDGAQTIGINMTLEDKEKTAALLDHLGVDYIEGGFPGANSVDTDFFDQRRHFENSTFTAFGMLVRAGRSPENDETLNALINSQAQAYCLVGKSWDWHTKEALGIENHVHFSTIEKTIAYASSKNPTMLDAEHFFDGYKANPEFALQCLKSALDAGASHVVLCDTNGGTMPYEVASIVSTLVDKHGIPSEKIGIHTHDDKGMAVANTIMAVQAGASLVQGTLAGIGERCGNANLITLLPTFVQEMGLDCGAIDADRLVLLKPIAEEFANIIRKPVSNNASYVGRDAFATKAGIHASAQLKNPAMYEHVEPHSVGNKRKIHVTNQSGFANIKAFFNDIGVQVKSKDQGTRLLTAIDAQQSKGYAYDEATESLELFVRRKLGQECMYFDVERWSVNSQRRMNARGEPITVSEATIMLTVNGEQRHEVDEGIGPIDALDNAFRKALMQYFPVLKDMELRDYHVDLPKGETTTNAFTRVSVISIDTPTNTQCNTMGVSQDVTDASVKALLDSYRWRIMRNGLKVTGQPAPANT